MIRYSTGLEAGTSSSRWISDSITGMLSGVAVTTSVFERRSGTIFARTSTGGPPSGWIMMPSVRPLASS